MSKLPTSPALLGDLVALQNISTARRHITAALEASPVFTVNEVAELFSATFTSFASVHSPGLDEASLMRRFHADLQRLIHTYSQEVLTEKRK